MPLTLQTMINNELLDELANCANSNTDARLLLTSIGFPAAYRPNFERAESVIGYWTDVCSQIEAGRTQGGLEPLLAAAARKFPGNKKFAPFAHQPAQQSPSAYIETVAANYDVFLSYSSRDFDLVKKIAEGLKQRGLNPWFDEWALGMGKPFVGEIEKILSCVKSVVVFYGSEGYGPWQTAEVDIAISHSLKKECLVIPVMLPNVKPADLPPFLRRLKAARVSDTIQVNGLDVVIDQLVKTIRAGI
jgi:hypothetical protein